MAQSFKRAEIEEEQVVQVEKSNCLIRRKREAVVWCGVFWLSSYCLPSMIWAGQPENDLRAAKGEIVVAKVQTCTAGASARGQRHRFQRV